MANDNQGMRQLGETTCSAASSPGISLPASSGRGTNAGMTSLGESVTAVNASLTGLNEIDFLRCRTETLIAIVEKLGGELAPDKLRSIHNIAQDRLRAS